MKKLMLTVALAAVSIFGVFAGNATLLINGMETDKVPVKITFDGDNAILHFENGNETYDMESVTLNFTNLSGIEALTVMQFNGIVGNTLSVGGLEAGCRVEIYDVAGRLCVAAVASESNVEMDLSSLADGVYMLRAGNDCVKFVKK